MVTWIKWRGEWKRFHSINYYSSTTTETRRNSMANPLKGHPNLRRAGRLLEFSHMQEMTHSDFHEKNNWRGGSFVWWELGVDDNRLPFTIPPPTERISNVELTRPIYHIITSSVKLDVARMFFIHPPGRCYRQFIQTNVRHSISQQIKNGSWVCSVFHRGKMYNGREVGATWLLQNWHWMWESLVVERTNCKENVNYKFVQCFFSIFSS